MIINFSKYDRVISTESDLQKYIDIFEKEIEDSERGLLDFIDRANIRLKKLKEYEENNECIVVGRTFKNGKNKDILLIIRYPDGTQRDERYSFAKISDMRNKMNELKEKYSGFDWSNFEYEI